MSMNCCSKCKTFKCTEDFYKNPTKKNGLESNCKKCVLKRKSESYKKKNLKKKPKKNLNKILEISFLQLQETFTPRNGGEKTDVLKEIITTIKSINTSKVA